MCSLQGVSSQLALLQMRRAYTVVLDLAGAALLLKCTRMQIQGQVSNCLRSRTALDVHVFPILHKSGLLSFWPLQPLLPLSSL